MAVIITSTALLLHLHLHLLLLRLLLLLMHVTYEPVPNLRLFTYYRPENGEGRQTNPTQPDPTRPLQKKGPKIQIKIKNNIEKKLHAHCCFRLDDKIKSQHISFFI